MEEASKVGTWQALDKLELKMNYNVKSEMKFKYLQYKMDTMYILFRLLTNHVHLILAQSCP